MAEALASLARDELHNPLRFVVRPPGEPTLMGLMPAHRSAPAPLYALKTVVIAPANSARGLDLAPGVRRALRRRDRRDARDHERGRDHCRPHGCRLGRRDARCWRARTRARSRSSAPGIQAKAHLEAMRAVRDFERVLVWSRTPGRALELDGVEEAATAEEAVREADVVVTATSAPEPILAAGMAEGGCARERRRLEHPDDARARHGDDGRGVALRRPARVDAQRGGRLPVPDARGRDRARSTSEAELGEILIGAVQGRTSDDELTVFKSLGLAVEDLAAAEHVLRRAEAEDAGTVVSL